MTSDFSSRPELMLGPNPFIEALPPFLTAQEMARQFGHYPLAGKPWQQLTPAMREPLLEFGGSIRPLPRMVTATTRADLCQACA